ILWNVFAHGNFLIWIVMSAAAFGTAFYMFRLVSLTFLGKERFGHDKHPHESPSLMTIPLIVLAALSVVGGFINVPEVLFGGESLHRWLEPIFYRAESHIASEAFHSGSLEYVLMAIATCVGVVGILFGLWLYKDGGKKASSWSKSMKGLY